MARLTDAATLAAIAEEDLLLFAFGSFDFADGMVYLWSGPLGVPIVWDGQTWIGTGEIAALDRMAEDSELAEAVTTVRLQIDGDLADDLTQPINEGRAVVLTWAAGDRRAGGILPVPLMRQVYTMGALRVELAREDVRNGLDPIRRQLVLELTPEPARLSDVRQRRLTYQDGLSLDPNDHFLEFATDPDMARTGGTAIPVGGGGPPPEPGETARPIPGTQLVP